jgi:DNA-binding MarR family transcriptional regulator
MKGSDARTPGRSMLAVQQVMAREVMLSAVQALGQADLTLLQLGCLMVLSDGQVRTVGEVSAALGRSLSATSRLLEQLVKRAMIGRAEDPNDRRARHVTISAAGRRFLLGMMRKRAQAELRLLGHLTAEERAVALRGLELLREAARRAKHDKEA